MALKLNGGLGTSMGMTRAKSLLEVKDGLTFLDVIVRQLLQLREQYSARIPLLLMNSFATRDDTLAALERYPELPVDDLPLDFVQGRVPKLLADGYEPASRPDDPGARVGAARTRRRVRLAGGHRPAGHAPRTAATATCSSPTPTISAPRSTRASPVGSPQRGCRSCRRWSTARRATRRAVISPGGVRTAACSSARRPRCPTRTRRPSRTSPSTATSTRTASG